MQAILLNLPGRIRHNHEIFNYNNVRRQEVELGFPELREKHSLFIRLTRS